MALFVLGACSSKRSEPPGDDEVITGAGHTASMGGSPGAGQGGAYPSDAGLGGLSPGGGGALGGGGSNPPSAAGRAGGGGAAAGSASCESPAENVTFEQACLACAVDDCERCLCDDCTDALQTCADTPGCPEILSCIREQQCFGVACYCGTFDVAACAAGRSNGPCKSAALQAPGSKEPTLLNLSAGPASDAALAIADCVQPGQPCAAVCPMGP